MPPQTKPEDKVGGLPWGLPAERYPICQECGKGQSLLIQLIHHPERLDLGRPGRNLFVFQCNSSDDNANICATWNGNSSANACFILEPEELTNDITPMPEDEPYLEVEAHIIDWWIGEDGIPGEQVTLNGDSCELSREELYKIFRQKAGYSGTRLGGFPDWVQDSWEAPRPNWKFVGQLSGEYRLAEEPSWKARKSPKGKTGHIHKWHGQDWGFSGPNLGDAGVSYIFVRLSEGQPEGHYFWQCA